MCFRSRRLCLRLFISSVPLPKIYGFSELRLPTVEQKELFVKSTGETTDIVQKEMYTFEDAGHRQLAIRPEGTPGVVRAYLENNFTQAVPLRRVDG